MCRQRKVPETIPSSRALISPSTRVRTGDLSISDELNGTPPDHGGEVVEANRAKRCLLHAHAPQLSFFGKMTAAGSTGPAEAGRNPTGVSRLPSAGRSPRGKRTLGCCPCEV